MRNKLSALVAAVLAIVIVALLVVVIDDSDGESPDNAATPSPALTPTASLSPTPQAFLPTFAPDGRTGIAELDRIIDDFIGMTTAELGSAYADVSGREYNGETDDILTAADWAARLANAERALFAVVRERENSSIGPPREFNVVLRVTEPGTSEAGWALAVDSGEIVDLVVRGAAPLSYTGDAGFHYERFLVLPPLSELPQAPPSHALSTRTGVAGVDALLAILEAHDGNELVAAAVMPVAFSRCRRSQPEREDVATRRLDELARQAIGVHAVAVLPAGYLPAADHMILVLLEVSPYRWSMAALIERDGAIVGFNLCGTDLPASLYPPQAYPAPPLADLAHLDTERRSGIAVIDAFLDALAAGDLDALLGLVDYEQVGCVTEQNGIGGPPICDAGQPDGTLLDVIPAAQCEGHYIHRESMPQTLGDLVGKSWALYSVVQPGPPAQDSFIPSIWQVILVDLEAPDDSFRRSISPWFNDGGLAGLLYGCGPGQPADLERSGTSPDFLLPPP